VQESTYQHSDLNHNVREAHREEEEAQRGPATRDEFHQMIHTRMLMNRADGITEATLAGQ
jgi:hypothetical protein